MSASLTGLSPSLVDLSKSFSSPIVVCRCSSTPSVRRPSVWPLSSSLATTKEIEFSFFSSGYLDVSLPRVPLLDLWIQSRMTGHYPSRVPPFGNPRINAYLRLPLAYRSLSRPSSAISALASTLRSSSLDLASTAIPFLRLLRWDDDLLCESFSFAASDWMPRCKSQTSSECLPCAVFKVRWNGY